MIPRLSRSVAPIASGVRSISSKATPSALSSSSASRLSSCQLLSPRVPFYLPSTSHVATNTFSTSSDRGGAAAGAAGGAASAPRLSKDKVSPKMSVKFSLPDSTGSLSDALSHFARNNINMSRLESRPSKRSQDYDFYIDFVGNLDMPNVQNLLRELKAHARDVSILESRKVKWFPRRVRDLDLVANVILDAGSELQADHPGFNDPEYRKRRAEQAQQALNYKHGERVPRINYTPEEVETWGIIYNRLLPLLKQYACAEHVRLLPLLQENCGYRANNIPQLQDISDFLKECTGFTIRPVAGLLSARNFLYGLAFRTFFSTQYIRHHSKPLYTPEPDLVHELMGHAPLFADQSFADFSQEIGLASIGATDEQITKLARCYWFSVEFGLCLQDGQRKAYGAGLLSSFGELEYSMGLHTEKPKILPWDPFVAGETDYPITCYQPTYFMANSFEEAKQTMQAFSGSFAREFNVRYNPYTQTLDVDGNISVEDAKIDAVKK